MSLGRTIEQRLRPDGLRAIEQRLRPDGLRAIAMTVLALGLAATGCEEPKAKAAPPAPPHAKPTIINTQALCKGPLNGPYLLESIQFDVEDCDGLVDLDTVEIRVEGYDALTPTTEDLDVTLCADRPDASFGLDTGVPERIRRRFAWHRSPEGPDIFCGQAQPIGSCSSRDECKDNHPCVDGACRDPITADDLVIDVYVRVEDKEGYWTRTYLWPEPL